MKELPSNNERLVAGFEVFLNRHLKPGDFGVFVNMAKTTAKERLDQKFPVTKAGSMNDQQLRVVYEVMGTHYGARTSVGDQKKILTALLEHGVSEGKILSIGCGLAPHEIYLASQGLIKDLVGVDTSSSMLKRTREIAKQEGVKGKFIHEYGSAISFEAKFDQVLIIDSLHWMRGWKQCLIKSARALKDNGTLFILYSIYGPVVKINPMGIANILKDNKVNIEGDIKKFKGHSGSPRVIISARKTA